MAGTRLAAHSCFLIFSLISVLVAWRLGVVKRAPLPLRRMSNPYGTRYPPQPPASGSSSPATSRSSIDANVVSQPSSSSGPLPPPVDIDVVLLRSPRDRDCPSCAAALDAMQANPSLARNAFRAAEEKEATAVQAVAAAAAGAAAGKKQRPEQDGIVGSDETAAGAAMPLLAVREVNLRVVHADRGIAAGNSASPPLSALRGGDGDGGGAAALDNWLHRHFILQPNKEVGGETAAADESCGSTAAARSPPPRYTFFVACAGAGAAGDLPIFTMGKHRHGYLGLGCACSSCASGSSDSSSQSGALSSDPSSGQEDGGRGNNSVESRAAPAPSDSSLASAAALAVLQTLAGLVVAHVLRSPVRAGDVHVRQGQAYRLNFSLLSEDPGLRRCAWDFAAASRRYLRPLLRKLLPVAGFAVQSQEVQYARLSPAPPRWFPSQRRWYYTPQDLQGFLGANDFSTLDLAAGWGSDGGGDRSENAAAANGTLPSSSSSLASARRSVSSPHSQVPVNFMMFCPSPKSSPLVFMEEWRGAGGRDRPYAEAYEVPGFGGVSVVNDWDTGGDAGTGSGTDVLEPDRLRRAFGAHVSQLRRIIGLPRPSDRPSEVPWPWLPHPETAIPPPAATTTTTATEEEGGSSSNSESGSLCGGLSPCAVVGQPQQQHRVLPLTFLPSPTDGATDWEVDALLRAGMARNRAAAAETLRSLAALVESQPEMEVSAKIAEDVAAAIEALANVDASIVEDTASPVTAGAPAASDVSGGGAAAAGDLGGVGAGGGCPPAGAMRWAREGLRRSEAAYFDPTMVPQLYFPQDHLMAVYFPFLAPLAFPLIVGFAQELLRFYRKKKARSRCEGDAACGEGEGKTSSDRNSSNNDEGR